MDNFAAPTMEYSIHDDRSRLVKELGIRSQTIEAPVAIKDKMEADMNGIEKQLDKSDYELAELHRDGLELITNICIANDKREIDRRNKEADLREELLENLQKESIEAAEKFKNIASRWGELDNLRDPMSIYEGLEYQKARIDDLLRQKDLVIEECRKELDAADLRYAQDLEKQSTDIFCLVERVDKQIILMKKSYLKHVDILQNAIDEEREIIRNSAIAKWEELYNDRIENEEMKLTKEKEMSEIYSNEMAKIAQEHAELTRTTRIRLEKDNQDLQIELELLKANVLLNSDKLDYNFQILKKREEENGIVRNQQKRRITRLNETVNSLKNKLDEIQKTSENEISKLTDEISKWRRKIFDLEEKSHAMLEISDSKFTHIWDMNYEQCVELLNKVLAIDQLLHEQQLGIEWQEPTIKLIEKEDLTSYKKSIRDSRTDYAKIITAENSVVQNKNIKAVNRKEEQLFQMILRAIADRGGFLVEKKVVELLKPFCDKDQTLVKIDHIFQALNIHRYEDVLTLQRYFLKYGFCPSCNMYYNDEQTRKESTASCISPDNNVDERGMEEQIVYDLIDQVSDLKEKEAAEISESVDSQLEICSNHHYVLQSAHILEALRTFVEEHLQKCESKPTKSRNLELKQDPFSRSLSRDDVIQFWDRFKQVFSNQKESLWTALEHGLIQHSKVLKKREKLGQECEELKQQNSELKFLMQQYMPKFILDN